MNSRKGASPHPKPSPKGRRPPTKVDTRLITAIWVGVWVAGFTLTHLPKVAGGAPLIPHLDKFAHLLLFFVVTYLGGIRVLCTSREATSMLLAWGGIYLVYAALDEVTQPLTGRQCNLADWIFDACGVLLATVLLQKRALPSSIRRWLDRENNVTNN